ncbi:MAG: hypothetical protein LBU02_01820 [Rickettsiales bacterium]|jgi:hypothetical protein|nr:hypothetical protein [Rickettsiales bacterium]
MIEHINEVNNISFGEMYKPLFPSREKGTRIDWESAFLQQGVLLKSVKNNVILPEISHSPSKGNQLGEVGTMLDDIENDKHIRKKRQRS